MNNAVQRLPKAVMEEISELSRKCGEKASDLMACIASGAIDPKDYGMFPYLQSKHDEEKVKRSARYSIVDKYGRAKITEISYPCLLSTLKAVESNYPSERWFVRKDK